MPEQPPPVLRGLSPITAEMVGEISNLSVALAQARQMLTDKDAEIASLQKTLADMKPKASAPIVIPPAGEDQS